MSTSTSSIHNMNITTLIKEIFQTMKSLEAKYYSLEAQTASIANLDKRLASLEQVITGLADQIGQLQIQTHNQTLQKTDNRGIDPLVEAELKQHLAQFNGSDIVDLRPNELTIANLEEQQDAYTMADVEKLLF